MIPEGKFEFNYWNRLYEIERISFTKNSSSQIILRTKESRLGRFGKQNGYFSGASLDLGNIFQVNLSYNNMIGNQWSDKEVRYLEDKNQTFLGSLKLKKSISRLQSGSAFYQQRNVPNPFNTLTAISFFTPDRDVVLIGIYDMLGNLVEEITNEVYEPGMYRLEFNSEDVAPGTYFIRMTAAGFSVTNTMNIVK